jgi:molybdopterin molybdotransferase
VSRELRHLTTLDDARRVLRQALPARLREGRYGERDTPIAEAVGFVLGQDVVCPTDLPPFGRATMDGYAVRAEDTFGASEGLPAYLKVAGEVRMGEAPAFALSERQAAVIPTGGMLPAGADAVVMIEHTQPWGDVASPPPRPERSRRPRLLDSSTIEVLRPVAPGDNIVHQGDDVRAGKVLLPAGRRLRPQDISALAGLGISAVRVRRPRVAVLSTGSELVPHDQPATPALSLVEGSEFEGPLPAGRIRDMNGPALQAAARAAGAEPIALGLVGDDAEAIRAALGRGLAEADIVLVSGGTSVGMEDVIHDTINSLGKPGVLVHGLAVKPGKPVVIALVNEVPVFGLPGHPTSCLLIFRELVAPLLRVGGHFETEPPLPARARLTRNYPSQAGREELVPVRLDKRSGAWEATPLLGPSAFISTLVAADGLIRVPLAAEGLYAGDEVEVEPFDFAQGRSFE